MSNVIVAGPDEHGLGEALEAEGADVTRIPDVVSAATLEDADIHDADVLVLTDTGEATAIPIAKELNPDVRDVAYAEGSLPESMDAIADLSVDPRLMDPEVVAEELLGEGDEL
ncbi:MAG: CTP synthetase [Halopenitus sp.]